jgi:outer membrane protein assembly factor BamB
VLRSAACFSAFLGAALAAAAADWPQILGPNRDGVSLETGLLRSWPREGPPLVWAKKVGEGYSGPVVAGNRLILLHRVGDSEIVECLDAASGKERWKFAYPTSYQDQVGKGDGPRATPVVSGRHVYTLGAEGRLHCLDLATGAKVWERQIMTEYKVRQNYFGVGATPLVEGKLLLVNVGGKSAGIVAFDLATGREVWKATGDGASYASPVAATLDGVRTAIFFTRNGVVLLDPADGKVRFSMRWRSPSDASVNAATPLVVNDEVFFSASYDTGALLLRVRKGGVEEVWKGDESLSSHYSTSVYHGGYLYGFDGRQEAGARLRCVEWRTGKVRWTQAPFGCGTIVLADGRLIVLTERGDLVLVEPSPDAYREISRARVLTAPPCRAPVALADGRLYARDMERLVCWNLKK